MDDAGNANNRAIAHDTFCWDCGNPRNKYFCTTCFRAVHAKCLMENDKLSTTINGTSEFICRVCTLLEKSKVESVGKESNLELLKHTMNHIMDDPNFKKLERLQGENIVHPIGLNDIKQKVDSMSYDSLQAFLVDIECIHHNHFIYGCFNEDVALRLVNWCDSETQHITSCAECYKMKYTQPNDWRTRACAQPHLLLWVKLDREMAKTNLLPKRGIPYWPAKLFSVDDDSVNVILFCRSNLIGIPIENCFLYATEPPRKQTQTLKSKDIEDALKEVNLYKRNVELKFGRFGDDLKRIPFNPSFYTKYMRAMFPDYNCGLPNYPNVYLEIKDELHDTGEAPNDAAPNDVNDESDESSVISVFSKKRAEKRQGTIEKVSQMIKSEPEIYGYEDSDADTMDNSFDDSPVPNKRPRLSHDLQPSGIIVPISTSSINPASEPNSNQNSELPDGEQMFQEELQTIWKRLEELTKKRENTLKVQIEALHQEVSNLKRTNDDFQAKNNDLLGQLKIVTDQAKNEVEKMKEKHSNEMNQMRRRTADEAKAQMENHLVEIQTQHENQLDSERKCASDVAEKLKVEREKVTQLENDIKTAIEERSDVEAQLKKKTVELNRLKSKMKQLCN